MNDIRDIAASYYPAIDRSDVEHVLDMYAENGFYNRAGIKYPDMASIRKFFVEDRQISGTHSIEGLWSDEESRTVFVTGHFDGQDRAGTPRSFGFADIWHFDEADRVSKRESYLASG